MIRLFLATTLLCAIPLSPASAQHNHDVAAGALNSAASDMPSESGQSAFGAIAEVVAILEANSQTDWSKANIDALREHLVDMDNVTLRARVTSTPVANGVRFDVDGDGAVRDSIRRMIVSHAGMANGEGGQHVAVAETHTGATMTLTADDPANMAKIRALGFFGAMTRGVHHQRHHLMMAKGDMHH